MGNRHHYSGCHTGRHLNPQQCNQAINKNGLQIGVRFFLYRFHMENLESPCYHKMTTHMMKDKTKVTHSDTLNGVIFVMIGPGGAGKNAIMKAILKQSDIIQQLATATTRPMRDDEAQGREHLFVSLDKFKEMIANNELLEYQEVTPQKFYGVPRQAVADNLKQGYVRIADIEVLGAQEVFKAFPHNVVQIFVTVPGDTIEDQLQVLADRMKKRDDHTTNIQERLNRAKNLELPYQSKCDYIVINDDLSQATDEVTEIIQSELEKRDLIGQRS